MMLGVRAHDFGKLPVEQLAQKIHEKGLSCIQLALPKAIAGFDNDIGRLNPGLAWRIRETFHKYNIQIAVLGCYINPVHPDPEERRQQLNRFKEYIRFARDFGCSIIGTETGSLNRDFSFNPENHGDEAFKTLVQSVTELVEEAEKFGVFVGIEGVRNFIIHSPQRMKHLIDAIGSNHLQVIFDPVNYLSLQNYKNQDQIIKDAFNLFGDRIQILHAKDFIVENDTLKGVRIGSGILNYELLIKLLKIQKPYVNILMEEAVVEDMDKNIQFIKNVYKHTTL